MKKFLMCLLFLFMAGAGYGFSCDTVPDIDQKESMELSVDNTVSQDSNFTVAEFAVIKNGSLGENLSESFKVESSKEQLVVATLILRPVLEPDLFWRDNLYNLTLTTLKNSQFNFGIYRRARDGLQNG